MTHTQIWLLTVTASGCLIAVALCATYFTLKAVEAVRGIRNMAAAVSTASSQITRMTESAGDDALAGLIQSALATSNSAMAASEQLRDVLDLTRNTWSETDVNETGAQLATSVAKLFSRRGAW